MPENLSLYSKENAKNIIDVIPGSLDSIDVRKKYIFDFKKTNTITLSGGIFLYGVLQLIKFNNCPPSHIKKQRTTDKIKQILDYLESKRHKSEIPYDDILCWKIQTFEQKIDNQNEFMNYIENTLKMNEAKAKLRMSRDAILEILSNCVEHAYTNEPYKKFYLFSGIAPQPQSSDKKDFTFCIFDHGRGIKESFKQYKPGTSQQKLGFKGFKEKINAMRNDGNIIKRIIAAKRTGTQKSERGKGLHNVLDRLKRINGSLLIYSRKGYFMHKDNKDETEHRNELPGTLVQFSIPVD